MPSNEVLYVAPEMIVHYIEAHGYSPPKVFQAAVMNSPLPESEEYQLICEPFWQHHRAALNRMFHLNG